MIIIILLYIYIYIHKAIYYNMITFMCIFQSCTSKFIRRQGIGSFARTCYVSTLLPVVICPYLCTSEVCNLESVHSQCRRAKHKRC